MGGCRCSYKNCKNSTKSVENIHFFHYPVKQKERCKKWIENANKPQFCDLEEDQLRNKVICEMHFEDKYFPNPLKKRLLQTAIPTLDAGATDDDEQIIQQQKSIKDAHIVQSNTDGSVFTIDAGNSYKGTVRKFETYIYKNGTLVSTNADDPMSVTEEMELEPDEVPATSKDHYMVNIEDIMARQTKPLPKVKQIKVISRKPATIQTTPVNVTPTNAPKVTVVQPKTITKVVQQNVSRSESPEVKAPIKPSVDRTYLNKINQHSREIASIKRLLRRKNPVNNADVRRYLKMRIPSSLYTIVSLCLGNETQLNEEDYEFFVNLKNESPKVYSMLTDKYKWCMPNIED